MELEDGRISKVTLNGKFYNKKVVGRSRTRTKNTV